MAARLKKGDTVVVISGSCKGQRGEIIRVFPLRGKAVVSGVNMSTRHNKPKTRGDSGSKSQSESPIDLSNVAYFDVKSGKSGKVGFRIKNGKKLRFLKSTGELIDGR